MEMTRIRCTNCGAEFENVREGQTLFRCTRQGCGCVFLVEQGQQFFNVKKFEAEKIAGLRAGMKESLTGHDYPQTSVYAKAILEMLPRDFRAGAAFALCELAQGHSDSMLKFLKSEPACTQEDFLEMFPLLLEKGGYREICALEENLNRCVAEEDRRECETAIRKRKKALRLEADRYADIPRDVFVCHSSADREMAEGVVQILERDGNQCWLSSRNLPPESADYWAEIEKAVRRCRIFLVLCSEAAMFSPDVQRELTMAEKYGLARLELKLDKTKHTTQFHYFFDGISWIDAQKGLEKATPLLKERVYELKKGANGNGEGPRAAKIPEEPETERTTGNNGGGWNNGGNRNNGGDQNSEDNRNNGIEQNNGNRRYNENYRNSTRWKNGVTEENSGNRTGTRVNGASENTEESEKKQEQNQPAKTVIAPEPGETNRKGVGMLLALEVLLMLLFLQDSSDFWEYLAYKPELEFLTKGANCFVTAYTFVAAGSICILLKKKYPRRAMLTALPGVLLLLDIFCFHQFAGGGQTPGTFYSYGFLCVRVIAVLVLAGIVILINFRTAMKWKRLAK